MMEEVKKKKKTVQNIAEHPNNSKSNVWKNYSTSKPFLMITSTKDDHGI